MAPTSTRGSKLHTCACAALAAHARATAPATGASELRNDNDITCLKHDVLLQVSAARNVGVLERQRLLAALRPAQDHDIAERSKRRRAARHAERLHDIDARIHDELAGLVHLPEHVHLVSLHFLNRHGDDRVGDEFLQLLVTRSCSSPTVLPRASICPQRGKENVPSGRTSTGEVRSGSFHTAIDSMSPGFTVYTS